MSAKKLVIVDDEPAMLEMLSTAFKQEGHEIKGFLRARDALVYIQKNLVEVVVTDIMMPEMNGIELVEELKEADPLMQIIAITGFPSLEKSMELCQLGVNDIIIKPFAIADLTKVVEDAFKRVDNLKRFKNE